MNFYKDGQKTIEITTRNYLLFYQYAVQHFGNTDFQFIKHKGFIAFVKWFAMMNVFTIFTLIRFTSMYVVELQ